MIGIVAGASRTSASRTIANQSRLSPPKFLMPFGNLLQRTRTLALVPRHCRYVATACCARRLRGPQRASGPKPWVGVRGQGLFRLGLFGQLLAVNEERWTDPERIGEV